MPIAETRLNWCSVLRNPNLVELSRQHQHVLALCVRIVRALRDGKRVHASDPKDLASWRNEVGLLYAAEVTYHFVVEERVVFPAAAKSGELKPLVAALTAEHGWLRAQVARVAEMSAPQLVALAEKFSEHIRKEERELFEGMQRVCSAEELDLVGAEVARYFQDAGVAPSCRL
jgi:hemerythrin-like domain-containing protein